MLSDSTFQEGLHLAEGLVCYAYVVVVSKARTKERTAGQRWLPVPHEPLDEIADLAPLEDRGLVPDRPYSHVLLDHRDEWQQFWGAAHADERSGGVVPVWSREGETGFEPPS